MVYVEHCGACKKELHGRVIAGYFGPDAERFELSVKPEWTEYFCPGVSDKVPVSRCFNIGSAGRTSASEFVDLE